MLSYTAVLRFQNNDPTYHLILKLPLRISASTDTTGKNASASTKGECPCAARSRMRNCTFPRLLGEVNYENALYAWGRLAITQNNIECPYPTWPLRTSIHTFKAISEPSTVTRGQVEDFGSTVITVGLATG